MSSRRLKDSRRPKDWWTGDEATLEALTNAALDKRENQSHRRVIEGTTNWLRSLPPRSKAETRKRHLILGKRAEAKHYALLEQRAIKEKDIETLRRLHPEKAEFLNLLRKRGRPKRTITHDPDSPECRLEDAREDARRIRAFWRETFGHSGRPTGSLMTAAKIAARRHGLTEDDVRKGRVSRTTRARLGSA
jgi:hypothetical protein